MFKSNAATGHSASKQRKQSAPESQMAATEVLSGDFDHFERQIRERIDQNLVRNGKPDASSDLMKYQLKNLSFFKSLNTSKPPAASKHSMQGSQLIYSFGTDKRPYSGGSMGLLTKNEASADFNLVLKSKEPTQLLKPGPKVPSRTASFDVNTSSQGSKDKSLLLAAPPFEYSLHEMRHNRAKSDLNRGVLSGKGSHISPILEIAAKAGIKFSHHLDSSAPVKRNVSKTEDNQHPLDSLMISINEKKRNLQDASSIIPQSPGSDGGPVAQGYFLSKKPPAQPKFGGVGAGLLGDKPANLEFGVGLKTQAAAAKVSGFAKAGLNLPKSPFRGNIQRPMSPASTQSKIEAPFPKNIQEKILDWKSYAGDGLVHHERKSVVGFGNLKLGAGGFSALESKVAGLASKTGSKTPTRLEHYSQAVRLATQIGRPGSASFGSEPPNTAAPLEMNAFFKKKSLVEEVAQQVQQRSKLTLFGDTSFGRLTKKTPHENAKKLMERDNKFLESKHKLLELNSSFKASDSLAGLESKTLEKREVRPPSFSKNSDLSIGSLVGTQSGQHWREAKGDAVTLLGRHSAGFLKGRKPVIHGTISGGVMRPSLLTKSALWLD